VSISFASSKVQGFDKTLVLFGEGYVGKPVTVNGNTISGLTANAAGKKIIPQGTYLTGATSSLLDNPQQLAVQSTVSETKATATVNTAFTITAKESGALVYTISLVKGTKGVPVNPKDTTMKASVAYTAATNKFVVTLQVDEIGTIYATYGDVVAALNNDLTANSFIVAAMANGVDETTVAAVTSADVATAGGAAEVVTGIIDGILLHSIDVTNGEAIGTLMIAGYVNVDNLATEPSTAVKSALPKITFSRID